ncbi:MAG: hypothetical protein ABF479_05205 [Gluconacetobacter sp.]
MGSLLAKPVASGDGFCVQGGVGSHNKTIFLGFSGIGRWLTPSVPVCGSRTGEVLFCMDDLMMLARERSISMGQPVSSSGGSSSTVEAAMLERSQARAREKVSVRAMAHSLIVVCGDGARGVTMRHIARCLDQDLPDDVLFWLKVRNQIDWLMRTSRREGDSIQ